jgi:vacuolar-type H+-ATPase subunit E/Vma4
MNNEEDNIQALSRAVMTEARSEAEQTLMEARQKAEAIRADSERQAEAERARILENANKEAARLRSQAVAAAHLKARTYQLEQRELLLNKVFEQASQRLAEIQKNGSYADIVLNLLKESLLHLGSDSAIVMADEKACQVLTPERLDQVSQETGIRLQLGEPMNKGMGVVVQTPDGHRRYDNTLETRMKHLQDSLRNPVYRLLMGESDE